MNEQSEALQSNSVLPSMEREQQIYTDVNTLAHSFLKGDINELAYGRFVKSLKGIPENAHRKFIQYAQELITENMDGETRRNIIGILHDITQEDHASFVHDAKELITDNMNKGNRTDIIDRLEYISKFFFKARKRGSRSACKKRNRSSCKSLSICQSPDSNFRNTIGSAHPST